MDGADLEHTDGVTQRAGAPGWGRNLAFAPRVAFLALLCTPLPAFADFTLGDVVGTLGLLASGAALIVADVVALFVVEANAYVMLKHSSNVVRAARVNRQAVWQRRG